MSRSTLTVASSLLLAFTPSISPADAVLDAEQILSLLPADMPDEQKNALVLSASILLTANPNLPPHDAVGDAMQLWEIISE